jgi:colanic acid/amylovoran biosynthesis glycosyltransferase
MKVLMFNHAFFHISETFIYKQVTGMPADVQMELLSFEYSNAHMFPLTNKKYRIKRSVNFIDRVLNAFRKRVLNIHHSFGVYTSSAVKKILQDSKPEIVHAQFGFNALLIYPIAKQLNIPLVVTFHGLDASPHYLQRDDYKKKIQNVLAYASGIIIVSPHMIETLDLKQWASKTHLIPCGVNPNEFHDAGTVAERDILNILHSGRLVSKKGVPDLVKVFSALSKRYPHLRLNIIGDGPELNISQQLGYDVRTIKFYGSQPHEEVKKFMSDTDIFVLNSRVGDSGDMEGLPVSLLEAMSMGKAVISTRHAGIPEAITDGVNGLLVNEKDNAALSAAIEKLTTDSALRNQLGQAARVTVINKFTIEQANKKIDEVYRKVVS